MNQVVSPAIDVESSAFEELIRAGVGSGDYAYVDRSLVVRLYMLLTVVPRVLIL